MTEEWNEESKVSSLYKAACNGIKAPEELYGKVVNMKEKKRRMLPKAAVVAIAIMIGVLGSNGIVYASTGTGWIGRIIVAISGQEKDVHFEKEFDGNGEAYYIGTVQDETGNSVTITTRDMSVLNGKEFVVEGQDVYVIFEDGTRKKIECYDQEDGYTIGTVWVTPLPER